MHHANYKKWSQEIIPNLGSKSVIVFNSASYHNVKIKWHPTSLVRKGEMLFWLDKHGVCYSSDMIKVELYHLIKIHKPQYEIFAIVCPPTMDAP
jgi:hypothetical protein